MVMELAIFWGAHLTRVEQLWSQLFGLFLAAIRRVTHATIGFVVTHRICTLGPTKTTLRIEFVGAGRAAYSLGGLNILATQQD